MSRQRKMGEIEVFFTDFLGVFSTWVVSLPVPWIRAWRGFGFLLLELGWVL